MFGIKWKNIVFYGILLVVLIVIIDNFRLTYSKYFLPKELAFHEKDVRVSDVGVLEKKFYDEMAAKIPVLQLTEGSESETLAPWLFYFRDPLNKFNLTDILNTSQGQWTQQNLANGVNFGYDNSTFWFVTALENLKNAQEYVLNFGYTYSQGELFVISPDGGLLAQKNTYWQQDKTIPLKSRSPSFLLKLKQHSKTIILFRVMAQPMKLPITVESLVNYSNEESRLQIILGISFGSLLVMMTFSSILWLKFRESTYAVYVLFLFCLLCAQLAFTGDFFIIFGEKALPLMAYLCNVFAIGSVLFLGYFQEESLNLTLSKGFWLKAIQKIRHLTWVVLCLVIVIPAYYGAFLTLGMVAIGLLFYLVIAVSLTIKKNEIAIFILSGFGFGAMGVSIYVLTLSGLMPLNLFTENSMIIFTPIDTALFAMALVKHYEIAMRAAVSAERELLNTRMALSEKVQALKQSELMAEVNEQKTRLSNLGHVAIRLGDRINTPLAVILLGCEELETLQESVSPKEMHTLVEQLKRAVSYIKAETHALEQFKKYAPEGSLHRELGKPE